jgi:uncharacterized membrane protein
MSLRNLLMVLLICLLAGAARAHQESPTPTPGPAGLPTTGSPTPAASPHQHAPSAEEEAPASAASPHQHAPSAEEEAPASAASPHQHAPSAEEETPASAASPHQHAPPAEEEAPASAASPHQHLPAAEERVPTLWTHLREHPHNAIVHFPLALALAGALFILLSYRWPGYDAAARLLLALAGLAAIGAVITGQIQEEHFEHGPLHEVVELHEKLGFATLAAIWLSLLAQSLRVLRPVAWLLALALWALVLLTGYYGGGLAHATIQASP